MDSKRNVIVTGSHRSGTTWTGRILTSSPQLNLVYEPFNIKNRNDIPLRYWFEYIHAAKPLSYLSNVESYLESVIGSERSCIKDPLAVMSVDWLANRFDADVVFCIRHPAAFAGSLKIKNWKHPFSHFSLQPDLMDRLPGTLCDQVRQYAKREYGIIDQAILLWNIIYDQVRYYQELEQPGWHFVRHEDFSRNPTASFRQLFSDLELSYTGQTQRLLDQTTKLNELDQSNRCAMTNIWTWHNRLTADEINRVRSGTSLYSPQFYSEKDWEIPSELKTTCSIPRGPDRRFEQNKSNKQQPQALHCYVYEGLCNRINALASAIATGSPVVLHWSINKHCPASFNDLFDPIPNVEVLEESADGYPYSRSPQKLCWFYPANVTNLEPIEYRKRMRAAYRMLVDSAIGKFLVPSNKQEFSLGVHYRHHLPGPSNFDCLLEELPKFIQRKKATGVYVASDSEQHKQQIVNALVKIGVRPTVSQVPLLTRDLDRSHKSVQGMLQDLRWLTQCHDGVICNNSRSTVCDSLFGYDINVQYLYQALAHRNKHTDALYAQRNVDSLLEARIADMDDDILVACVNGGYATSGIVENWYRSIERCELRSKVLLVVLDTVAQDYLTKRGIPTVRWNANSMAPPATAVCFRAEGWRDITFSKIRLVHRLLAAGKNVLFSDVDIVVLKNPFASMLSANVDIAIQSDVPGDCHCDDWSKASVCSGFYLVRSNQKTIHAFNCDRDDVAGIERDQQLLHYRIATQQEMSSAILPRHRFPNGSYWEMQKNADPTIIHYNWCVGVDEKISRMKRDGNWFV